MSIQTFQSQQQKYWIFVSVFRRSLKSNNAWMCHDLSIFRVLDNELCQKHLKIKFNLDPKIGIYGPPAQNNLL